MFARHHVANGGSSVGVSRCSLFTFPFFCYYCLFFTRNALRVWHFSGRCRLFIILRVLFEKKVYEPVWKRVRVTMIFFFPLEKHEFKDHKIFVIDQHHQLKWKQKWAWDILKLFLDILLLRILHNRKNINNKNQSKFMWQVIRNVRTKYSVLPLGNIEQQECLISLN